MIGSLLRFEWRYYTRQMSFAAAALIFTALGFAFTATRFGPSNVHVNSPFSVAETAGVLSLASVFVLAVFCANAVVRDREHQVEEILFATPVRKRDYVFSRFGGSFLAAFTAYSFSVVGMLGGLAMPWQEAERIGRVSPLPYAWALVVIALPGVLAAAVTLFASATLTRSVVASVVGAVAIYVLYFVAAAFTNSPLMAGSAPGAPASPLALLLDPFGLAPFFEQTRFWTPAERNVRLVSLSGMFLINRVIWVAYSAAVLALVYRRFRLQVVRAAGAAAAADATEQPEVVRYNVTSAASGRRAAVRAFLSASRLEVRAALRSIPFLLLVLLWGGLAVSEILSTIAGGEYGSALYPLTGFLLMAIQQPLSIVGAIVIVYYSSEILWRERSVGLAEIVNATPAPNGVFVIAKWLALSAMVIVLAIAGIVAAIAVQIARGWPAFEPGVIGAFAVTMALPLVLLSGAAILVQTLSPQKYAGMLFVFVVTAIVIAGPVVGINHPLWRFAFIPPLRYSSMNGFGPYVARSAWFVLLWTLVAGVLLMIASVIWRAASSGGSSRGAALAQVPRSAKIAGAVVAFLAMAVGAFVFYNTNVVNEWASAGERLDWRAGYEKKYRGFALLPEPAIVDVTANVALFPRERRFRSSGTLRLVNESAAPVERILVSLPDDVSVSRLTLSGGRLLEHDARFGTWLFRFDRPLASHAPAALAFDLGCRARGFSADEPDNAIAANGTYLPQYRFVPSIGYRSGVEIDDPLERRKRGLPPKDESSDADVDLRASWATLDLTLSTDADQTAIAPGTLESSYERAGRRWYRYRSARPLHNALAIASGRYEVASEEVAGVKVSVYHDPRHGMNVARILRAANTSLQTFSNVFGRYPERELRIVEVPAYARFGGFATPGVVFLNENRSFLIDARDAGRLDLVTRRTAHEIAHQWWGHFVSPAGRPGATTIVESLTKYSELLVLRRLYGDDAVRKSLVTELDMYLAGRAAAGAPELPLSRQAGEDYLYYRKGAVVMNGIRTLLGEETFNRALRAFVSRSGGAGARATVPDLLREIDTVATPAQRALVDDWMNHVVLYDLRVGSAVARRRDDGTFDVTVEVIASRERADGGVARPLPLHEPVQIALLASDPDNGVTGGNLVHLTTAELTTGRNFAVVNVPKVPQVATIDPFITRVDRSRFDNSVKVEAR